VPSSASSRTDALLPIAELVRVARLLDDEHHCALADEAAARWGRAGAVFVRSSASHVFLADDLVLRMAPLGTRQADDVARSATSARTLHDLGAPVPAPVASTTGSLVEEVDGMVVTALPRVPGTTYDDDLTLDQARLWGRTLAAFHATGWVHGDPEPDNLVIDGEVATFVDLDDARPNGDLVDDVAFALRAWTPPGGAPNLDEPVVAAFVDGYGAVDPEALATAAAAVEERTLESYEAHLGSSPDPDWQEWARRLHARIAALAAERQPG
jgi:Ser/Thr protein kinase RdoA (MazF antagonist)